MRTELMLDLEKLTNIIYKLDESARDAIIYELKSSNISELSLRVAPDDLDTDACYAHIMHDDCEYIQKVIIHSVVCDEGVLAFIADDGYTYSAEDLMMGNLIMIYDYIVNVLHGDIKTI